MDPNPVELFLHIAGVIAVFVGYGILALGTVALRRAARIEDVRAIASALTFGRRVGFEHISVIDVIVVAGVLVIAVTGLDMARYPGDWRSGWLRLRSSRSYFWRPLDRLSSTRACMPSRAPSVVRPKAIYPSLCAFDFLIRS